MGLSFAFCLVFAIASGELLLSSRHRERCDGAFRCFREFSAKNRTMSPGDSAWVAAYQVTAIKFNQYPPKYVILPRNEEEVQQAVLCASRNNVQFSVKGGGHSFAGFSIGPVKGFQLNMRDFCRIQIGDNNVTVTAGCRFQDLYDALEESSRIPGAQQKIFPGGYCPSVGVIGFVLGGGIGAATRAFGMGIDNVLEFRMVPVNGSGVVVASATQNTDLFWALRGGGGGSFGVVTSVVLSTPVLNTDGLTFGRLCRVGVTRQLSPLTLLAPLVPEWLALRFDFENNVLFCWEYHSLRNLNVTLGWLNDNLDSGIIRRTRIVANIDDINPATLFNSNFATQMKSFFDLERLNARFNNYQQIQRIPSYERNCIANISSDVISVLEDIAQRISANRRPLASPACTIAAAPIGGGAAATISPDATSFPYRNFQYVLEIGCPFFYTEQEDKAKQFVTDFANGLANVTNGCVGAYVNFPSEDMPDFATAYWGSNLLRLKSIRGIWNPNPNNVLSFSQQVPLP